GGKMSQAEYDDNVADLVAYVTYMSDPTAQTRTRLGVWVLLFLGVFTVFAWMLNREYWKDVK
ncbi:MAG TPA: cytochrome c1, partial [Burkholderiaceae bacterium]|nr:cytochrome c1 [Burkholderiaceae bacterium]